MDDPRKSHQEPDSPQREAIRAWERRRKLRPIYSIAGLFLLIIAWGLRHTAGAARAFCVISAFAGVVLISMGRWSPWDGRCPVCGCFNASRRRGEYHCGSCGFDHYDF